MLIIKALIMAGIILYSGIGLGPDEAQYWTWSKALDWGYYSKPPGIAWQIWLGTQLFGDTELGVRIGSIVMAFLLPLAVFFTAKAARLLPNTCFWAALMMALSPLGVTASLFAITDVGMVLFWTIGLWALIQGPNYIVFGLSILWGALFKWPLYLLWIFVPILMWFSPQARKKSALWGLLLSLLGLLPSLIWNVSHDWVTFRHVFSAVGNPSEASSNFFEFIGAQAALMSPILFFLLLVTLVYILRNPISLPLGLLAAACFVPLFLAIGMSIFGKMQGNWCDFAYPSGFILLAWFLCEQVSWGKLWLKIGVAFSLFLSAFLLSIPYLQKQGFPIPHKWSPFKQNMGWDHLSSILTEAGYDPTRDFLFGDKYQTTSLISFYGPQQKRAYFLNLQGMRKNQFSFWPSMAQERKDSNGYFVAFEEKDYQKRLTPYFANVEFVEAKPLYSVGGVPVKSAYIYRCLEYNGLLPKDPEKY